MQQTKELKLLQSTPTWFAWVQGFLIPLNCRCENACGQQQGTWLKSHLLFQQWTRLFSYFIDIFFQLIWRLSYGWHFLSFCKTVLQAWKANLWAALQTHNQPEAMSRMLKPVPICVCAFHGINSGWINRNRLFSMLFQLGWLLIQCFGTLKT